MLDAFQFGVEYRGAVHHNSIAARLVELALRREEGVLSDRGALVVHTGKYTGRSPHDKFTVKDAETENSVWWGSSNQSMTPEQADHLFDKIKYYLGDRSEIFSQDCHAGASEKNRLAVRIICERAWHAMFARNMFLQNSGSTFSPEFTVYHAPGFKADPAKDGTNSEAAVIIDFSRRRVLICGTEYAGEIKKSIFTVMNYLLPARGLLGMHCSANRAANDEVTVFFGLSGTGKTTLSADPSRQLIGDDEHGWGDEGVFNFEGGCYAKVIRLSKEDEPEIYRTTQTFGTILENVVFDPESRKLDLADASLTENTRASYDISQITNAFLPGTGAHPKNIVMLTCDAFGVLPPISRLTPDQAMYHFISGYTARVAGTERGVTEPSAVFSTCFGAPFMPRHPSVYAELLGKRMHEHEATCWLVNTGWSGGPYGVGNRMKIKWTRAMLDAALSGKLSAGKFVIDPFFGLSIPQEVPMVPSNILQPRQSWKEPAAYDKKAKELVALFRDNFVKYADRIGSRIQQAQPGEYRN